MSQTSRPWQVYGHFSDMNKSVHTPADLGRFIYSVTDQQTLAGLWTKKNVSFVYSIIHAKYILFMMCRHSPLTVKHLTRYHTTVLPLSPWHSLSSSPTPVSSPHFMPRIIPKSITENFSKINSRCHTRQTWKKLVAVVAALRGHFESNIHSARKT